MIKPDPVQGDADPPVIDVSQPIEYGDSQALGSAPTRAIYRLPMPTRGKM
jgi:hypothetical protein